jgi:hypothetical protein
VAGLRGLELANLTLIQKTGGAAIAALERKMLDESFLQNRKFAILRVAFDCADSLAVEVRSRNHATWHGVARPVGIINDHCAVVKDKVGKTVREKEKDLEEGRAWRIWFSTFLWGLAAIVLKYALIFLVTMLGAIAGLIVWVAALIAGWSFLLLPMMPFKLDGN